jgi:hypothetical protein
MDVGSCRARGIEWRNEQFERVDQRGLPFGGAHHQPPARRSVPSWLNAVHASRSAATGVSERGQQRLYPRRPHPHALQEKFYWCPVTPIQTQTPARTLSRAFACVALEAFRHWEPRSYQFKGTGESGSRGMTVGRRLMLAKRKHRQVEGETQSIWLNSLFWRLPEPACSSRRRPCSAARVARRCRPTRPHPADSMCAETRKARRSW